MELLRADKKYTSCWNSCHSLTNLNRKNVGILWMPTLNQFRNWPKKNFSSMALENIAIFWISWKSQRGDPSMKNLSQKIFVSDFNKIQNLKFLWPKDFTLKIWAKLEMKIFWNKSFIEGLPLWIFQEIQKIAIFSKAIDEKLF